MKKPDLILNLLLVPVDFVMLFLAGLTSYWLRYSPLVTRFRPVFFDLPLNHFNFNQVSLTEVAERVAGGNDNNNDNSVNGCFHEFSLLLIFLNRPLGFHGLKDAPDGQNECRGA